ncbi:MAG: PIN domain-containing protein [Candidatus Nanoarchaeia archaeon]|jgi:rRNA-processing protein FCF1
MTQVIFDTNALLIPFMFKVNPYQGVKDLVPGAELVTLEACVNELKGLKPRQWESIIDLGLRNGLKIIKTDLKASSVDDLIVEYARPNKALVLTQDRLLKKKLLNNSLRVVILRQKNHFVIMG